MRNFGIMQGRLVPPYEKRIQCFPRNNWANEFKYAAEAGLDCIEWIFDLYGFDVNPIMSENGIDKIIRLSFESGVKILSLCADYFMDRPLIRTTTQEFEERFCILEKLMGQCQKLGISRIVLPFVDQQKIETDDDFNQAVFVLKRAINVSEETNVEIHLETSLSPIDFARLLDIVTYPNIKVNYDSGNSSSLGYHPTDEFSAYGFRVGSVHIKDRVFGGSTVSLGTGDTDFLNLFENLKKIHFGGDFILQAARGEDGLEIQSAIHDLEFIKRYLSSII